MTQFIIIILEIYYISLFIEIGHIRNPFEEECQNIKTCLSIFCLDMFKTKECYHELVKMSVGSEQRIKYDNLFTLTCDCDVTRCQQFGARSGVNIGCSAIEGKSHQVIIAAGRGRGRVVTFGYCHTVY